MWRLAANVSTPAPGEPNVQEALNDWILSHGYYALAEQRASETGPDGLTLESQTNHPVRQESDDTLPGAIAVTEHPPQVQWSVETETAYYLAR